MDDYELPDTDGSAPPERPVTTTEQERVGVPWGAMMLLIWAVALIIFSVQNAEDTTVEFLGWSWNMPVALLVMVTALATLVLTGLGSAFYRRRRRRQRQLKAAAAANEPPTR